MPSKLYQSLRSGSDYRVSHTHEVHQEHHIKSSDHLNLMAATIPHKSNKLYIKVFAESKTFLLYDFLSTKQRTMTPNDLTWHFQKIDNVKHFNASKLKEFHRVCVNGFGIAMDWDSDNKLKLSKSNLLGELLDREGELCGIAYYCLPEKRLENTYLLWENGICLVKKAQKLGLSKAALEKIKLTFSEYLFGWFGGKTQNPKMFLRYKKFGKTFPFDELYLTTKGTNVMNFLINNIEEVKNLYESKQLNLDSGICFNAYSHGYLGDYNVGLKGTELFESQLKKMGFNRSRGDAIIVIAHNDEYQDNKIKEAKHNDFVDRYSNRQGD